MKKILAVSGGVDSVVLLHMYRDDPDAVVAHFNHGVRTDVVGGSMTSADADEAFVCELAKKYEKPFYAGHANLGEEASEESARISRYEYFNSLARELEGEIYTAHHADDLIESIAINIIRGTGWRGIVPFGNTKIRRPFIETELLPPSERRIITEENTLSQEALFRSDIYRYASQNNLVFRLDPTNSDEKYLRNRVRQRLATYPKSQKKELLSLYHKVNNLKTEIDDEIRKIPKEERNFYMCIDDNVAIEILRALLLENGITATRPQLKDFLNAVRTYKAGKKFNLPNDNMVKIGKNLKFFLQ